MVPAPGVADSPVPTNATEKPTWTVLEIIRESTTYLEHRGVGNGRLNAEQLLANVLKMERLDLYLHFDRPVLPDELQAFKPLLRRRAAREPAQYILGTAPFRNLTLQVDSRVLIPRPETEYFLDALWQVARRDRVFSSALDLCTGSGAIALALASERMAFRVTATDISEKALEVARANANLLLEPTDPQVDFRHGPLLEPVAEKSFDLILTNPPYLSTDDWHTTEPEVHEWEPRLALEAGQDGLEIIRQLVPAAVQALRPGGWVGVEVGSTQTEATLALFRASKKVSSATVVEDLSSRPRYVFAQKAAN